MDNCEDYKCEGGDEAGHSHVGVRPYLRRVIGPAGTLIDGKTDESIVAEVVVSE